MVVWGCIRLWFEVKKKNWYIKEIIKTILYINYTEKHYELDGGGGGLRSYSLFR